MKISHVVLIFFIICGVAEVWFEYRLLETVLFLTDSVFIVLFSYFDESMGSIGGYEPWRSCNTVDITPM